MNQYALVAYIDGKLGEFLYRLRQEIVPACRLRSHVSILPPRPLAGSEADATALLRANSRHHAAFEVSLGAIEVFPITDVIYIDIAGGLTDLHEMHGMMNAEALRYAEPFSYHPHITLTQEISQAEHAGALQLCKARWKEFTGPRQFPVETLTFVQNTSSCGWVDLAEARLEMAGSRR
ncbi:MAG: 2'-5' RNA ligase family protein [Acidobacteria bacterium]|nr:2'-5' RNA ligase family protein [Acidobacteriota bacterium]